MSVSTTIRLEASKHTVPEARSFPSGGMATSSLASLPEALAQLSTLTASSPEFAACGAQERYGLTFSSPEALEQLSTLTASSPEFPDCWSAEAEHNTAAAEEMHMEV